MHAPVGASRAPIASKDPLLRAASKDPVLRAAQADPALRAGRTLADRHFATTDDRRDGIARSVVGQRSCSDASSFCHSLA